MLPSSFRTRRQSQRAARRLQERRRRFVVEHLEGRQLLSNVVDVTNTSNSGAGSLRSAIMAADSAASTTTIDFDLPGTGLQNIELLTPLPAITKQVFIDGTSQSGYSSYPVIELDGASAGKTAVGLQLEAGAAGSVIQALVVDGFGGGGVMVSGGSANTIVNSMVESNGGYGIEISQSRDNVVSGDFFESNGTYGVELTGTSATDNLVSTGSIYASGIAGVYLAGGASGNTIGGMVNVANGIAGDDLVISDNASYGVELNDANGNAVEGAYIGTDYAGTAALANGTAGVYLRGGSSNNTIGGTSASARDLISGNASYGVEISGASGNFVEGDFIGTDSTGTVAVANGTAGVYLTGTASGNIIGGTSAGDLDLISGNASDGVEINGAKGNFVEGDLIGTAVSGATALGNGVAGVYLTGGASGNTIGAFETFVKNVFTPSDVISGNTTYGIEVSDASDNTIEGDFIGTDLTGSVAVPNSIGVILTDRAANNTIGGTSVQASVDVISGNTVQGVVITGAGTSGNVLEGNLIGTNIDDNAALPNLDGVLISGGASGNTIGSVTVAGGGNELAGNTFFGVLIENSGTTRNVVAADFIGSTYAGAAMPNLVGVEIASEATDNTVGGTVAGAGNIIAGNLSDGVVLSDAGTTGNVLQQNLVGLVSAESPLANGDNGLTDGYGVLVENGATRNTIGGTTAAAVNTISGNGSYGVVLSGMGTSDNLVEGNYIGTDATGTIGSYTTPIYNQNFMQIGTATIQLGNGQGGVLLSSGASLNTIGGTTSGALNVISANLFSGVEITGASKNLVEGDFIGTDVTGTVTTTPGTTNALGNSAAGVFIDGAATDNTIGGTTPGARDVISGNGYYQGNDSGGDGGVFIAEAGTTGNVVEGDYIGTDYTGKVSLGNFGPGVYITNGASRTTVGGTASGAGDLISANTTYGVLILSADSNLVEGDYIGTNSNGTGGGGSLGNGNGTNLYGVPVDGSGVYIGIASTGNTIGGTSTAARDVISGNTNAGVVITDSGTEDNVVEGDDIGTNAGGTAAIGNGYAGVIIQGQAACNTVGGTAAGASDVISGNSTFGVFITGGGTQGNVVEGDYIGTNYNGTSGGGSLGNGTGVVNGQPVMNGSGVEIGGGATGNIIGGTSKAARDVISGNTNAGVVITDSGTEQNVVLGDDIGTNAGGTAPIGNVYAGVIIQNQASYNTVGGTVSGAGDVISGNGTYGVLINGTSTDSNLVEGDFIGTNYDGATAAGSDDTTLGNNDGVDVENGAAGNTIGGTTTTARDVISGNSLDGVQLSSSGPMNVIEGDFIGINAGGTAAIPNGRAGVTIQGGSTDNTVGGTAAGSADVISGNLQYGVWLLGSGTSGNVVEGDFIGTNDNGTSSPGSMANEYGVALQQGASSNTIGGTAAAARNIISGNTYDGVYISDAGTSFNWVQGNYIGTNAAGTAAIANGTNGVVVQNGATLDNVFNNVISGNHVDGVLISGSATQSNTVESNLIGVNAADTAVVKLPGSVYSNSDGVQVEDGALGNAVQYNVLSGNIYGVEIDGTATDNYIDSNFIGTDSTGKLNLGNMASGVYLNDTSGNQVYGNTIDNNGGYGILFTYSATTQDQGNTFANNSMGNDS